MYKIGLSTIGKNIDEDLFREYQTAGLDCMEISHGIPCEWDFNGYLELSKKYGVELNSYHLPYEFTDISNKEIFDKTLRIFSEDIKKATSIGIDKIVIHASGEIPDPTEREERLFYAKKGIEELAEIAKKGGAFLCVENLPRTCLCNTSVELKGILSVHDNLKVCFDTNHLLIENPVDFINNIGDKIITTHVSDYDFINERHWLPGEGKLEWDKIIKALNKINYNGVWLYEVPPVNERTIIRERQIFPADFVKNAKELFSGKKPTIFSKNKPNLGMWE